MTQRQVAFGLRVSVQAVSKWERELTYPDVTLLIPIAELFCISLDDLFGR
jgi:DNA-binding XRE family transcriptional regulator